MKQNIRTILLLIVVTSSCYIWAGEFEDGMRAWERKDYVTAKEKFSKIAEQGDAEAQIRLGFSIQKR